jgi:hypothetical protein
VRPVVRDAANAERRLARKGDEEVPVVNTAMFIMYRSLRPKVEWRLVERERARDLSMKPEHEARRKIIREWMLLLKDKL